ncbi:MAG TPA: TIGR03809 family protein [Xanthobacteraceae bacterium]|nr:TIGR03809 family protein [Xanthobacteraceae bacterium]
MFAFEAKLYHLRRRQMSEHKDGPPVAPPRSVLSLDPVALKWRNLADRRRAHLVDLYLTGRWKRYYSEEQFLACFRETMSMADRWNEIAPKSDNDNAKTGS